LPSGRGSWEDLAVNENRSLELFFELFGDLPRQGPGDVESTRRAFALVPPLDSASRILDLGCGSGAQTLALAAVTPAQILAIDSHPPFIARLNEAVRILELADRIQGRVGDMAAPDAPPGSVDLIWAEGSIYNIGFEQGLASFGPLLRAGGHVAVTEACWLRPDPPAPCREFWNAEYPAIADAAACLEKVRSCGYAVVGHFALPAASWWADYYKPLQAAIDQFRLKYEGDGEALAVADASQREIEIWREYQEWYGYVFFVMRK
jgi:SAM-dependent methyltransferase